MEIRKILGIDFLAPTEREATISNRSVALFDNNGISDEDLCCIAKELSGQFYIMDLPKKRSMSGHLGMYISGEQAVAILTKYHFKVTMF